MSHLGEMEKAVGKLQRALTLNPQDKAIQIELKRVLKKKDHTLRREKAMYRRMVGTDTLSHMKKHQDSTWVSFSVALAGNNNLYFTPVGPNTIYGYCRCSCCHRHGYCLLIHPKTNHQLIRMLFLTILFDNSSQPNILKFTEQLLEICA
jgi:hypothetical protein